MSLLNLGNSILKKFEKVTKSDLEVPAFYHDKTLSIFAVDTDFSVGLKFHSNGFELVKASLDSQAVLKGKTIDLAFAMISSKSDNPIIEHHLTFKGDIGLLQLLNNIIRSSSGTFESVLASFSNDWFAQQASQVLQSTGDELSRWFLNRSQDLSDHAIDCDMLVSQNELQDFCTQVIQAQDELERLKQHIKGR